MKTHFVETKLKKKVVLPKRIIDKLPEKIMLVITTQLAEQKESIIKQLEVAGKKVFLKKLRHTTFEGQILGCDTEKIEGNFEAFFYIGDGLFHPQALIIKNGKPVHIYNFIQKKYSLMTKKDSEIIRKRLTAAKTAFFMSKNIGVLVTTKQGQNKLSEFMKIKNNYKDKNFYFLVNNNLEPEKLEDFSFIECFVNTACERIAIDDYKKFRKPIINFEEL
ncbi:hypothetical protein CMO90_01430 [Candidatus Woesearchaeota archaeon]|jgi:2-(3-amino-3-carboxypropyl)histidine synthase|nr:hypothetical protein [Candidatus Woesearchaeota archaeon]|tara:strand:- start:202 stop:858 length:657 start_codon:yes stop_codon:yes gene_type:complete